MDKELRLRGSQEQLEAYTIPVIEAMVFEWIAQKYSNGNRPIVITNKEFRETFAIGDKKRKGIIDKLAAMGIVKVEYRRARFPYDRDQCPFLDNYYTVDYERLAKREGLQQLIKENSEYYESFLVLFKKLANDVQCVKKSIDKWVNEMKEQYGFEY